MKSLLISIKPKYVAKILNGEKTIEIRKTMPKCDLPIDVYIYCTKEEGLVWDKNGKGLVNSKLFPYSKGSPEHDRLLNGKVVAKFTLNKVDEYYIQHQILEQHSIYKNKEYHGELETSHNDIVNKGCISPDLVQKYLDLDELGEGTLFGWHISNLKIFDEPKELSEFKVSKIINVTCNLTYLKAMHTIVKKPLTKAPQSWCYVESEE